MEIKEGNNLALIIVLLAVLVIAGLFGSKIFRKGVFIPGQAVSDQSAIETSSPLAEPQAGAIALTIDSPQDNTTVLTSWVTVSGKTVPDADVSVNDKELKADKNGNFSAKIELEEGENIITVVANDAEGNYTEKEITVNLNTE